MTKGAMVTIMAKLILGCNQGTGPEKKVEVLAAIGQDQAEDFIGQVEELAGARVRSRSRSTLY